MSLTVAAGERRAVLGANGAGKTTLFNAITGDFPPTAGRVRFFGEDITRLPPHERIRRGLRRTYQSSLLFRDLTVRDNLFLAARGVARGRFSLPAPARRRIPSRAATQDLLERMRLDRIAAPAGRRALPWPAAPARDRHGAGRRAAPDPVRRARRRPVAGRAARAGGAAGALPPHMGFVLIEHDLDIALRVVERVTIMHNGRVLKHGTPAEIEGDAEVQAIYMGGR